MQDLIKDAADDARSGENEIYILVSPAYKMTTDARVFGDDRMEWGGEGLQRVE